MERALLLIQVMLIFTGAMVLARPTARWVRRQVAMGRAKLVWTRWKDSGQQPAGLGDPAGWLEVPSTGINTLVVSGISKDGLVKFPCLKSIDAGERAQIILAHRDIHFRQLGKVAVDDIIRLQSADSHTRTFRVCEKEIVFPEQLESRFDGKESEDWLVLVTCYPFEYIGPAPKRFVVWARPETGCPL